MRTRAACDALCVCEVDGVVWIGLGWEREPEPREWYGMSPTDALEIARHLTEAAAVCQEHAL